MTEKITVFHLPIPGNGDSTVFEGAEVEYRMEEGGALRIMRWITATQKGDALFAPGHWLYVSRSGPFTSQFGDATEEQIRQRIADIIG
jgi:hypothetical protein